MLKRAWYQIRFSLWLLLILQACANRYQQFEFDQGVVVHLFRRAYANMYLIQQGNHLVLFDTGESGTIAEVVTTMAAMGLNPNTIDVVVLSHGHTDHSGGAAYLQTTYKLPIVAGVGDLTYFQSGSNGKLCPTDALAKQRLVSLVNSTYPVFSPDHLLQQPASLAQFSSLTGQLTLAPGHTPGSLVLQIGKVVFVGDLLRGAIWNNDAKTHFYQCDVGQSFRLIRQLLDTIAPEATTFFPGHFGPLTRAAVEDLLERHGY